MGLVQSGNDQEAEFHEIEIQLFHEIEIAIFHEIEILIFLEIEITIMRLNLFMRWKVRLG